MFIPFQLKMFCIALYHLENSKKNLYLRTFKKVIENESIDNRLCNHNCNRFLLQLLIFFLTNRNRVKFKRLHISDSRT